MEVALMMTLVSSSKIGLPSTRSMVMVGDGLALRAMATVTAPPSTESVDGLSEIGSFPGMRIEIYKVPHMAAVGSYRQTVWWLQPVMCMQLISTTHNN